MHNPFLKRNTRDIRNSEFVGTIVLQPVRQVEVNFDLTQHARTRKMRSRIECATYLQFTRSPFVVWIERMVGEDSGDQDHLFEELRGLTEKHENPEAQKSHSEVSSVFLLGL